MESSDKKKDMHHQTIETYDHTYKEAQCCECGEKGHACHNCPVYVDLGGG